MGKPRKIFNFDDQDNDIVIFTDGFFPCAFKKEKGEPMIGAVIFDKTRDRPLAFSMSVPQRVIDTWIPRKTQISMIEMFAPVCVLENFKELLKGKRAILFVDSEAVEGALIKGYSARWDLCELTGAFWHTALEMDSIIYIDRVPTDANPSDGLSRGLLDVAKRCGWHIIERPLLPSFVSSLGFIKGPGTIPSCRSLSARL